MGHAQLLHRAADGARSASGYMDKDSMPEPLKFALEATYRDYTLVAHSPAVTRAERHELARRSSAVAAVFWNMKAVPGLAWWTVAALSAAAEAFEQQAQDWSKPRPWEADSRGHSRGPRLVRAGETVG